MIAEIKKTSPKASLDYVSRGSWSWTGFKSGLEAAAGTAMASLLYLRLRNLFMLSIPDTYLRPVFYT